MTTTLSRSFRTMIAAAGLSPLLALPAHASDPIVGNWRSHVELYECESGNPLGPPFTNMTVFHHGGTLAETNTSDPSTRGPAFGTWRIDGRAYVGRFDFLRFEAGAPVGSTAVSFRRVLGADGQTSSGTAQFNFLTPDGTVVFSACSRFSSVRLR